jgi:hypothetical protein
LAQVPFFATTQSWLIKLSFDAPFLGKQKSDTAIKERRFGLETFTVTNKPKNDRGIRHAKELDLETV